MKEWINFAVNALHGTGPHIDQYYLENQRKIDAIAKQLLRVHPVPVETLYRGLLLNSPDDFKCPHPDHCAYSFSADKSVARRFADPDNEMAFALRMRNPNLRGYIIEHTPTQSEILYHYSWLDRLGLFRYFRFQTPADRAAIVKQREVILKNTFAGHRLVPFEKENA